MAEPTSQIEFHPAAEIFPLMEDAAFREFCADIKQNGLLDPIWLYQGRIIDGRNRYRACLEVGVEPRFQEWDGQGSLISFVVSLNLQRRHLSISQRAMIAANVANIDSRGRPEKNTSDDLFISQVESAEMFSVGHKTISRAVKVRSEGIEELSELVEDGAISVTKAAEIAGLPKGKQKRLIRSGRLSGKKLLTRLKIQSIESMAKPGTGCLGCDPQAVFNKNTVSAFLQLLATRAPDFSRYFNDIVEEIEMEKISESARSIEEQILAAIDLGHGEKNDLRRFTGIDKDRLQHTISLMLDYGTIEAVQQGGKTSTARGAAKVVYRRGRTIELDETEGNARPDDEEYY